MEILSLVSNRGGSKFVRWGACLSMYATSAAHAHASRTGSTDTYVYIRLTIIIIIIIILHVSLSYVYIYTHTHSHIYIGSKHLDTGGQAGTRMRAKLNDDALGLLHGQGTITARATLEDFARIEIKVQIPHAYR